TVAWREAHAGQGPGHHGRRGGARGEEYEGRGGDPRRQGSHRGLTGPDPRTRSQDRDVTAQHDSRGDVAVLVVAAGLGVRLGPGGPKALRSVAGQPLLVHAVRRVLAAPSVGLVVVAAP